MSLLDRLKPKRTTTHFEEGYDAETFEPTITTTRYKADKDFNPIEEMEDDTDVKEMEKEYKVNKREQKMMELEAERSMLSKKQAMKLEDLQQKRDIKQVKSEIRQMRYAPVYKTAGGLKRMGQAVRERDSGFVGGGQDKVTLDEGAVGNGNGNGRGSFFDFGNKGKIDWSGGKKTDIGLATGGSSQIDWGAKSKSKIDFGLGFGQRSAPVRRRKRKPAKKTTQRPMKRKTHMKKKTTKKKGRKR